MLPARSLEFAATVQHTLVRADGTRLAFAPDTRIIRRERQYLYKIWERLRANLPFFAGMSYLSFLEWHYYKPQHGKLLLAMVESMPLAGIVTAAGINYLATTFFSNTNPLINFNFHTYGTGDIQGATSTPTNATAATPVVVTQAAHPFFTNDLVKLTGITGITGINGIWQIVSLTSSTYSLLGSIGGGSGFGGGSNAAQRVNGQSDTALTTEVTGGSYVRGTGTQTNSVPGQYKTTVAVAFTTVTVPATIVEWGLFSALTSGTLWDRRWMNTANAPSTTAGAALTAAPITITATTDSINTTYTLTCTPGGS